MAKARISEDRENYFVYMGDPAGSGFGVDAEGRRYLSMMGHRFYRDDYSGGDSGGSTPATSNTSSNTSSNTASSTSSNTASSTPPVTKVKPTKALQAVPWRSVFSKYFEDLDEQPTNSYRGGGIVRGCGAAERGKTKGKMR